MGHWTLDNIPWRPLRPQQARSRCRADRQGGKPVEYNGGAYAHHLCRIFHDDPDFQQTARRWGEEEIQHGRALAQWAKLADPDYDFGVAFARFQAKYQVDFDSTARAAAHGQAR